MLGTSYIRCGLLCEGLSSQNFDGEYALCKSLTDDRASYDTDLPFSLLVPQVSIFFYFGILTMVLIAPSKGVEGIVFM